MAKLTLVELTNVSQFFGQSEYAMFLATTQDNKIIECGITHNSLTRKGFDVDSLESLVGCSVITKEYTDNRTGELNNPEDRIQMILDGDARLVLFNSINCTIKQSELYKEHKLKLTAATNAEVKGLFIKEKKMEQKAASLERLLTRALAAKAKAEQPEQAPSLDDDADDVTENDASPKAEVETADDLEF